MTYFHTQLNDPTCELCSQPGGDILWKDCFARVVLVDETDYPGLCRVILNAHRQEMTDLSEDERRCFMTIVFTVEILLREQLKPDKINLASLGNVVPHLHWHVIPRFQNDAHFPASIWSTRQRASTHTIPPGFATTMRNRLRELLAK